MVTGEQTLVADVPYGREVWIQMQKSHTEGQSQTEMHVLESTAHGEPSTLAGFQVSEQVMRPLLLKRLGQTQLPEGKSRGRLNPA